MAEKITNFLEDLIDLLYPIVLFLISVFGIIALLIGIFIGARFLIEQISWTFF